MMQFTLAAAALIATASAKLTISQQDFNPTKANATVVNRCSYPVYLWSIDKQVGCPADSGLKLETGDTYIETMRNNSDGGISVKLSKFETCGGSDETQLEYKLSWDPGYEGNYLDMSFVNCLGGDCPGWNDGFYLKSGNTANGLYTSEVNNEHCPIMSVGDASEAAQVAYVNWDDRQTKFCSNDANLALYLCGSEEPSEGDSTPAAPSSIPEVTPSSTPVAAPSSIKEPYSVKPFSSPAPAYTPEPEVAAAAAVPAPTPAPAEPPKVIKTEVVYETVYVKRHAHGRRHKDFHA